MIVDPIFEALQIDVQLSSPAISSTFADEVAAPAEKPKRLSRPLLPRPSLVIPYFFVATLSSQSGQSGASQTPRTGLAVPDWQTKAGGKMAFDAASVKLSKSSVGGHGNLGQFGGHVSMVDVQLLGLVAQAYKFTNLTDATNMIFGIPQWARSERFDIEAEAPGNPTLDQRRLMVQSLLADRFHLVAHREKRQLPVYAAVLAKRGKLGPQLRPHRGRHGMQFCFSRKNWSAIESGQPAPPTSSSIVGDACRSSCRATAAVSLWARRRRIAGC